MEDTLDYLNRYESSRKSSEAALVRDISNAYKNAGAKLILNFGRFFAPVIEDYGKLLTYSKPSENCDHDLAVQCWDPARHGFENIGFDIYCLERIGCMVNPTEEDMQRIQRDALKFMDDFEKAKDFTIQL